MSKVTVISMLVGRIIRDLQNLTDNEDQIVIHSVPTTQKGYKNLKKFFNKFDIKIEKVSNAGMLLDIIDDGKIDDTDSINVCIICPKSSAQKLAIHKKLEEGS